MQATPEDWLVAVRDHADRTAFVQLFEHFAPRVKAYLLRLTRGDETLSDELTQDVMLRVWRKARHYDPDRGAASTWVFTVARNAFVDHVRRKRPEVDESDPALVVDLAPRPDERAHATQRAERVRRALGGLPADQAHVLEHAYFGGHTLAEIAQTTGTPLGTVKSRVRLALLRLKGTLGGLT